MGNVSTCLFVSFSVKTSIEKVQLFDDAERNKALLQKGRKSSNGHILVKAVQKAEDYLRKRCLGSGPESNLVKVFGDLDGEYGDSSDEEAYDSSKDNATNNSTSDGYQASKTQSDAVSSAEDEDVCFSDAETMAQWKERRRVQNSKLLQSVKEGKVETHLLGVYTETIQSDRHQKFKTGSDAEKDKLKHVPWFGPIDDEEQQEEIYDYCSQLFKANFKSDGNFDSVAYLFEVWVPEVGYYWNVQFIATLF